MTETYRKRGSVVRWENGIIVRVDECGVAIEEGERFACHPEPAEPLVLLDAADVVETARRIERAIPQPLRIERLIVTEGVAEHECDGRTWREETRRIHLAVTHDAMRVLIDDERDIAPIVAALRRCGPEREAPPRLRLAPNVAAAITSSLLAIAPPTIRIAQVAGGVDGKGLPIVDADREPWPNWYRPSYRVRPIRAPLNLRVTCDVTAIERDRPRAVALLAPPDGVVLRVLVDDGDAAWPCTVRLARIDAVAREAVWYPHGGGSFGAEMML